MVERMSESIKIFFEKVLKKEEYTDKELLTCFKTLIECIKNGMKFMIIPLFNFEVFLEIGERGEEGYTRNPDDQDADDITTYICPDCHTEFLKYEENFIVCYLCGKVSCVSCEGIETKWCQGCGEKVKNLIMETIEIQDKLKEFVFFDLQRDVVQFNEREYIKGCGDEDKFDDLEVQLVTPLQRAWEQLFGWPSDGYPYHITESSLAQYWSQVLTSKIIDYTVKLSKKYENLDDNNDEIV